MYMIYCNGILDDFRRSHAITRWCMNIMLLAEELSLYPDWIVILWCWHISIHPSELSQKRTCYCATYLCFYMNWVLRLIHLFWQASPNWANGTNTILWYVIVKRHVFSPKLGTECYGPSALTRSSKLWSKRTRNWCDATFHILSLSVSADRHLRQRTMIHEKIDSSSSCRRSRSSSSRHSKTVVQLPAINPQPLMGEEGRAFVNAQSLR